MDFTYTEQEEAFRQEVRAWLEANIPEEWKRPDWKLPDDRAEEHELGKWWQRKLYDGGYAGIAWPKEYGGRGVTLMEQVIFGEETARYGPFPMQQSLGLLTVGATLMAAGQEWQKKRFLHKILSGEESWCQGFSEPDAGSDVANVQTTAVEEGDHWVVNGQKTWTTMWEFADFGLLVVKTDPEARRHRNLSYFIFDCNSPGFTRKPLRQMSGDAEFGEMFFDDMRIPKENLIGELNRGWYVAMTTLTAERGGGGMMMRFRETLNHIIKVAQQTKRMGKPLSEDPIFRQRIAQFAIEIEAMKYTGLRNLTAQLRGQFPGPEVSIGKLVWSEMGQRQMDMVMEMMGPYSQLVKGSRWVIDDGDWQYRMLRTRGDTLEMGTSEIQRNVIAERVLGLPRV